MYISKIQTFITQNNDVNNVNNKNNNYSTQYGLRLSAPLSHDTISFRETPKIANRLYEINRSEALDIYRTLKPSEKKLVHFIESHFSDLVVSIKEPKNPIYAIKHRVKSANSIKEKSGSRQWLPKEIVENMTDLIGMKFEMRNASKQSVEGVLDRFIPLIRSRKIELLEIENKRMGCLENLPPQEQAKYDYASIKFLEKMIKIQEEVWHNGHKNGKKQKVGQNLEKDFTPVNYNAIHILFRIPGKNSLVFELQIMGSDIAVGKRVDDLAFKQLDGKDIDKKYGEVKKIFEPFTNRKFFDKEPNAKEIIENAKSKYKKYRQEMFLLQREKEPLPYTKKKKIERFLPLSYKLFPTDIEIKYGIDSADFDYNNLYELIDKADRRAARLKKARETEDFFT